MVIAIYGESIFGYIDISGIKPETFSEELQFGSKIEIEPESVIFDGVETPNYEKLAQENDGFIDIQPMEVEIEDMKSDGATKSAGDEENFVITDVPCDVYFLDENLTFQEGMVVLCEPDRDKSELKIDADIEIEKIPYWLSSSEVGVYGKPAPVDCTEIDAAFPLLKGVVTTTDVVEACTGVNIAVMVGGFPRKEGMERSMEDKLVASSMVPSQNTNCGVAAHFRCSQFAAKDCKCVVQSSFRKVQHHWSERWFNQDDNPEMSAVCSYCDEPCGLPFVDASPAWYCLWCQRIIHVVCQAKMSEEYGDAHGMYHPYIEAEFVSFRS